MICEKGKEYVACEDPCARSCDSLYKQCQGGCVSKCFCESGTLENESGTCVNKEDCCTGNYTYKNCFNRCEQSCARYYDPTSLCNYLCDIGCGCKDGYWIPAGTNKCVLPQDCPAPKSG
ncbi:hypothetical protein GDO81_021863 [Engystomops pustulosus]|nr:hypothetical protein GDO81_021863 [Engystomops pustulosus]